MSVSCNLARTQWLCVDCGMVSPGSVESSYRPAARAIDGSYPYAWHMVTAWRARYVTHAHIRSGLGWISLCQPFAWQRIGWRRVERGGGEGGPWSPYGFWRRNHRRTPKIFRLQKIPKKSGPGPSGICSAQRERPSVGAPSRSPRTHDPYEWRRLIRTSMQDPSRR